MSRRSEFKLIRILYLVAFGIASLILISPFYIPIIFGATVSLALFPLVLRLEKYGLKRSYGAAMVTFLFTFIISIPLCFFLIKGTVTVTRQLEKIAKDEKLKDQGFLEIFTEVREGLIQYIHKFASKFGLMDFVTVEKIDYYLNTVNAFLLNFFRDLASSLPTMTIFLLILIICVYSFLSHADGVRNFFQKAFGFNDECTEKLIKIFIRDSRQVYMSNIVTGGVQSLIMATGVSLLGYGDFFVVFFVTLILSFIPVIGTPPVAFLFATVAFFKGHNASAIGLIVLGAFTGVIDNILRPVLATFGESRIPPAVALICVIGGALILGFPGLFIGLLVGSYVYDTFPIFWEEIDRPPEDG